MDFFTLFNNMCVVNEIHSTGMYGNMLTIEANVYVKLQKELPTSYNSQVNQRSKGEHIINIKSALDLWLAYNRVMLFSVRSVNSCRKHMCTRDKESMNIEFLFDF